MKSLFAKIAIFALAFAGASAIALPAAPATIEVAASNWKFTPNAITLRAGVTTQLHLTATGGVHGIKSDDLGIPLTVISPGQGVVVNVTPKKAGTYVLHCAVICGIGHSKMAFTVVVTN